MPFVRPKPGLKYRHPQTKELVPDTGFFADEHDLDTVRGLACGDLEECDPPTEEPAPEAEPAALAKPASPGARKTETPAS